MLRGSGRRQRQEQEPMPGERVVYVVDDDHAVRDSLWMLLESYGIGAHPNASHVAFLRDLPLEHGCLLVDVNAGHENGLEVLDQLRGRGITIPVIVMTTEPTSGGSWLWIEPG
jgi:two-component system, LuxR family, response regulator FixJ